MGSKPRMKSFATPRAVQRRLERLEKRMVKFAMDFCYIATVNPPGDR